jgi:L-fucose isomerase-like protein
VQAFPDDPQRMDIANRRDSFCGKMSVCNSLRQYGIPFTITGLHTVDPVSADFRSDLRTFVATCHVVRGMRRARIGLLGSRPAAFNTMRFSEKILELEGISVETLDLYEAFGRADRLDSADPAVTARRDALTTYARTQGVPDAALDKMARFGLVLERWMHDNELDATAIQCWMSMEEYFGIVPCAVMSMMSHGLLPNACESDVVGALSMLALQLASGTPSALVDWNNNYRDDPDKGVIFHCSNLPVDLFTDQPRMTNHAILAGSTDPGKTYGTLVGRLEAQPFTYCRVSTDDVEGGMVGYVGEGELTSDPLDTFGAFGVIEIPDFQDLLQFICENGFEHHVAISGSRTADALDEAFNKYLDWDVYYHA